MPESRLYNSEYYDAITTQSNDIEFYKRFLNGNTRLLELGCGTGRVALSLSSLACEIVGVDISSEMLLGAKSKNTTKNVSFIKGDITSVRLNSKFDLIYRALSSHAGA